MMIDLCSQQTILLVLQIELVCFVMCVTKPETLGNLYLKVLHLHAGLEFHLKKQILSHQALQEALNDPKNGESAFKHLKQQVWSLLY